MSNADVEIAKLQMRADTLEQEVDDLKRALKEMTTALTDLSTGLKLAVQELRGAISQPIHRIHDGWRVLAGVGTVIIGLIVAAGGVMNIVDHFGRHGASQQAGGLPEASAGAPGRATP